MHVALAFRDVLQHQLLQAGPVHAAGDVAVAFQRHRRQVQHLAPVVAQQRHGAGQTRIHGDDQHQSPLPTSSPSAFAGHARLVARDVEAVGPVRKAQLRPLVVHVEQPASLSRAFATKPRA
jgi:hypothetical protein